MTLSRVINEFRVVFMEKEDSPVAYQLSMEIDAPLEFETFDKELCMA